MTDFAFNATQLKKINEMGFSVDHVTNVEHDEDEGYDIVSFCDHKDVDAGLIFCAFVKTDGTILDVVHSSEI